MSSQLRFKANADRTNTQPFLFRALGLVAALTFCSLIPGLAHSQTVTPVPADVLTIGQGVLSTSGPVGTMADNVTGSGNVYIMDEANYQVLVYNPATGLSSTPWLPNNTAASSNGTVKPCTGAFNNYGDGCPVSDAWEVRAYGMAIDSVGNIYIADNNHNYVHVVIGANGPGTVLNNLLTALGVATNAPTGKTGYQPGYLYLVEGGGKFTIGTTPAGDYCNTGTTSPGTSGVGQTLIAANALGDGCLASQLAHEASSLSSCPRGVAVDGYGNVYVSTYANLAVRMIVANPITITGNTVSGVLPIGTITTIAGLGKWGGSTVSGISPGAAGTACGGTNTANMSDEAGDGCWGNQIALGYISGGYPWGVASDATGNVYFADSYQLQEASGTTGTNTDGLIRKLTPSTAPVSGATVAYTVSAIAGLPPTGAATTALCTTGYDSHGNGCPATQATINVPRGLTLDTANNLYFSDYSNNMVRRIDAASGIITDVAGLQAAMPPTTGHCGFLTASTYDANTPVPADAYGAGCLGPELYVHQPQGQDGVDAQGNVYVINSSNGYVNKMAQRPVFSATAQGSSSPQPMGFLFNTGTAGYGPATGNPFAAKTSEFNVTFASPGTSYTGSTGSCMNSASGNHLYNLNSNTTLCHLTATFTPSLPGVRNSPLVVTDNATTPGIFNYALTGIGTAPAVGLDPAQTSTIVSATSAYTPGGVAVDNSGNVYLTDDSYGDLIEVTGTTPTTILSGFSTPGPVTVAANGNVYLADKTGVYEVPAVGTGWGSKIVLSSAVSAPQGMAIDSKGNLFVADTGHSQILEFGNDNDAPGATAETVVSIPGQTLSSPTGIAVDANGNLFIANSGGSNILLLAPGATAATVVAGSLTGLTGLSLDPAGNLYYSLSSGTIGIVYSPTVTPTAATLYSSGLTTPAGIALDGNSNLFVADSGAGDVVEYQRSTGSLSFGNQNLYVASSPQLLSLSSTGNANLTLTSYTPSDTTNYSFAPSSSNGCVAGAVYDPGTSCDFTAIFTPLTDGSKPNTVLLVTTAVNTTTPSVAITGNGAGVAKPATTLSVTFNPTNPIYGQSVVVTATVTPASGTTAPTGTVSLSLNGATAVLLNLTASGSTAVATETLTGLTVGSYTVTANYAGDTNYGPAPQIKPSFSVTQATPTLTWSPSPLTQTYGTVVPASVLDAIAPTGIAGALTYTSQLGAASPVALNGSTTLVVGSYTITAIFTPTDITDYTTVTKTYTYTVTQAAPVISWSPSPTTQVYGTAIGGGVLNASLTSTVAGGFTYTAKLGSGSANSITSASVLGVGVYTLTATFTPTDTTDYATVTSTSTYTVTIATPVITWSPSATTQTYGTAIGSGVLDAAVSSPAGSIAYTSKVGAGSPVALTSATILNAASYTLTATFTPTDTTDYAVATATESYTVSKALPAVSLSASATTVAVTQVSTLTATVTLTAGASATNGQVLFYDGTKLLGTVEVIGASPATGEVTGTALLRTRFATGSHSLTAVYVGPAANYQTATSSALALTVTGTTASASTLSATADVGNPLNYDFTGTVTGYGLTAPSAQLTINDITAGNTTVGSISLSNKQTSFVQPAKTFATGTAPAAILSADFDNDGIPDLLTANSSAGTLTLVLGKTLASPVASTLTVGTTPIALAVGDFNGDGNLDIAVVNSGNNTVGILIGNGDGTFKPMVTYATGNAPSGIAIADINQDGNLDLVVTNSTDGTVSVLYGNGNGTFAAALTYTVGSKPQAVAVGNLGSATAPSIVVANNSSSNVSVLLNSGGGALATQVTYATGTAPNSIVLADINKDGNLDIVVTNNTSATVGVLTGNANGSFNAQTTTAVATSPRQAVVADFNGDGNPDVAVASDTGGAVDVLFGKGDGTFQSSITTITTGTAPVALAVSDLNGDGTPDITVANSSAATAAIYYDTTTVTGQLLNTAVTGTGTHQVDAIYPGDTNYQTSTSTAISVTARSITTPTILWTPSTLTQQYGPAAAIGSGVLDATTSGSIPGSFAYTATLGSGSPVTITSASVLTAGSYTIIATFTPTNQSLYNTATASITYTVMQVVPVITWTPSATTQVYGTAIGAGVLDATISGSQTGAFTYTAKTASGSPFAITSTSLLAAGSYTLTTTYTPTDTTDYQTVTKTQSYTVTQAALTVTVQAASKAYGAALPTLSAVITGFVNGETSSVLGGTASVTTTATASSAVGSYPITAAIGTMVDANYTFTFVPATLTVNAVPLTVTVNSATKVYGAALPTFTGIVNGIVNGDTLGGTLIVTYAPTTATASSPVGSYTLSATVTGSSAANYTVTVTSSTFTITAAPATITVASATAAYGAGLPTFTSNITGAVNGDTLSATYSTTATATSPVGSYPLTATLSGAAASNYNVTVVPSTYTITQALALKITIANATKAYGAALPTFTAAATGLVNGDTLGTTVLITLSTGATATSPIGSYTITGVLSGSALANYLVNSSTITAGTLTVTTAPTTTTLATSATSIGTGLPVTLTATVTSAAGTPTGNVQFYNGSSLLGTVALSSTTGSNIAAYTTSSLPAGTDSVTATYVGVSPFAASTSTAISIGVATAPDYMLSTLPASLTIASGQVGTMTIVVTPINGYVGNLSFTCGQLPQYVTCGFLPNLLIADGSDTILRTTLTVYAEQVSSLNSKDKKANTPMAAFLIFPVALMMFLLTAKRKALRDKKFLLQIFTFALFFLAVAGITACGNSSQTVNDAATGTSTITVTVSDTAGTSHVISIPVTIQ
jgi:hypothetical protein